MAIRRGASFSKCLAYRYTLTRQWNGKKGYCMFLMLNPSTADEYKNDATVERCERYARGWGYGGLLVGNIFAYRATERKDMTAYTGDPIGEDNDNNIINMAKRSEIVVCAWGIDGAHMDRSRQVLQLLKDNSIEPYCLTVTKDGEPGHPLYLKKSLKPVKFNVK